MMKRVPAIMWMLLCAASPALAAENELGAVGLKSLAVLLLVVVALFGLAWALKRYGPVARVKKSLGLTVMGQVALNQKASLALVRIGSSMLLLGVTHNAVSLVKDMGERHFEGSFEGIEGEIQP